MATAPMVSVAAATSITLMAPDAADQCRGIKPRRSLGLFIASASVLRVPAKLALAYRGLPRSL